MRVSIFLFLTSFSFLAFTQSEKAYFSEKQIHHFTLNQFDQSLNFYDSLCLLGGDVPIVNHQTAFLACEELLKSDNTSELMEKRNRLAKIIYGQEQNTADTFNDEVDPKDFFPENEAIDKPDVLPEFPGGIQGFYRYVGENMRYPTLARSTGVEGRVYISFIVDKEGNVRNVKVVKGIGAGCDAEAQRVIVNAPAFTPGLKDGEPVAVRMVLPIIFKLAENKRKKKMDKDRD